MRRSGDRRIGAIDDHPVILAGIGSALAEHLPGAVLDPVHVAVPAFVAARPPVDLVLLDLELRDGSDPADNVSALVGLGYPVLIFTQEQRPALVARAFAAGALGIVGKGEPLEVLAEAVSTALAGEPWLSAAWADVLASDRDFAPHLSPRETQILRMYAGGLPLKSVAHRLGISPETARTHLVRIRAKYSDSGRPVASRTDLFIRAVEDGILSNPGDP